MSAVVVAYEGGLRCRSEHPDSGTKVYTDAPKDHHGQGLSFSPSDLLSVSLGSCILTIMGIAAQSMGIDMAGATAIITKEMANTPRRIALISAEIRVSGPLDEQQRAKLEAAAHACPVHEVLGIDAPILIHWA